MPHDAHCVIAGIDLVRDVEGQYRVLEDNLRNPSGISYVIENRAAMTKSFRPDSTLGVPGLLGAIRAPKRSAPEHGSRPAARCRWQPAAGVHSFAAGGPPRDRPLAELGTALATLATDVHASTIAGSGLVEAAPEPVSCERLGDQQFLNEHVEYLAPSQHVQWGDLINEVASWTIRSAADDVREQVLGIVQAVPTVLTYEHGAAFDGHRADPAPGSRRWGLPGRTGPAVGPLRRPTAIAPAVTMRDRSVTRDRSGACARCAAVAQAGLRAAGRPGPACRPGR